MRSVRGVHYPVNGTMLWSSFGCFESVISLAASSVGRSILEAKALRHGDRIVANRGASRTSPHSIRCLICSESRIGQVKFRARWLAVGEEGREEPAADHVTEYAMSWDPVYNLVKEIPRGRVTTYGALAKALRLRGGARAAGYAMAACPGGKGIPWHRVIGAGGRLLIREPHSSLQRRLLESEGVKIDGKRVNMKLFAWTPVKKHAGAKTKSRARASSRRRAKSR